MHSHSPRAINHAETKHAHDSHRRGARIALVEVDGSVAILSTAIEIPAAARCTALVHLHQLQMD
jgi:hypothetical protein